MLEVFYRSEDLETTDFQLWAESDGVAERIAWGEFTTAGWCVRIRIDDLGSIDYDHQRCIGFYSYLDDAVLAAIVASAEDPFFASH